MKGSFLLNGEQLANLIHGQPLKLTYETEGCLFIIVSYNDGSPFFKRFYLKKANSNSHWVPFFKRLFFRKANGIFETVTNVYSPEIKLWGIGWGIKKLLHHRFRINFFNTRTQMMRALTPDLRPMPAVSVRRYSNKIQFPRVKINSGVMPLLVKNQLHIQSYDDFTGFKQQHPKYQTIK